MPHAHVVADASIRSAACHVRLSRMGRMHPLHKASSDYLPVLRFSVLTPFYDLLVALTLRERTFKHELRRLSMTS